MGFKSEFLRQCTLGREVVTQWEETRVHGNCGVTVTPASEATRSVVEVKGRTVMFTPIRVGAGSSRLCLGDSTLQLTKEGEAYQLRDERGKLICTYTFK